MNLAELVDSLELQSELYQPSRSNKIHQFLKEMIEIDDELHFLLTRNKDRIKLWVNEVHENKTEIDQIAIFDENVLSKILFVYASRLSYHDHDPSTVLYDISIQKQLDLPPQLKVYRPDQGKLKVLHLEKMQLVGKESSEIHFKGLENSALELYVKLFPFSSQTAYQVQTHQEDLSLGFTSAELMPNLFMRLRAFLELLNNPLLSPGFRKIILKKVQALMNAIDHSPKLRQEAIDYLTQDQGAYASFVYCVEIYHELYNTKLKKFLSDMLAKKQQQLILPIDHTEKRQNKVKEKGGTWAYDIPDLLIKTIDEFKDAHHIKGKKKTHFTEYDLDPSCDEMDYNSGFLIEATEETGKAREKGKNKAGVVVGLLRVDFGNTALSERILIIGDITHKNRGAITATECSRINAAIRLAVKKKIPIDWFPASYGVEICKEKGVESLDASAATAREIIKACHKHHLQINLVIDETNIGAQSYWDALAAVMPNTSGLLIMTDRGSMALTGHNALISAFHHSMHSEDIPKYAKKIYPDGLQTLSGYQTVHGPNSDAMLYAHDLKEACRFLTLYHYYTVKKVKKGETEEETHYIEECFEQEIAKLIKGYKPDANFILNYLRDKESPHPLSLWEKAEGIRRQELRSGEFPQKPSVIIQIMQIGHIPTMVIFTPVGPLTPADADLISRALRKASGRLPVLIMGSLTGFNCDPLSMENRQLVTGASIAEAIVQHKGRIVVLNMGNLVGGTFVVFSKELNPELRILALQGSKVQVIGGKAAAKVVFHSRIVKEVEADPRIQRLSAFVSKFSKKKDFCDLNIHNTFCMRLRKVESALDVMRRQLIADLEKQEGEHFDQIHSVQRALQVGSIDEVIALDQIKSCIIHHLRSV